jgi:hypothetical protein
MMCLNCIFRQDISILQIPVDWNDSRGKTYATFKVLIKAFLKNK